MQNNSVQGYINETYGIYLLISIALTIWVARTLFKNGRIFLVEVFGGNEQLADSVNHLLVVGFYLINLGYVALALKIEGNVESSRVSIEYLATKLGIVMLVLGGMHFLNLAVFSAMRNNFHAKNEKNKWLEMHRPAPPKVQ